MKRVCERAWWLGWRAALATGFGVVATFVVSFTGAVLDSALDYGGMAQHERYLRESNRWWDAVHAMASTPDEQTMAAVRALKGWSSGDPEPLAGDDLISIDPVTNPAASWPAEGEACDVYFIGWPARCLWGIETQSHIERVGLVDAPEWVDSIRYVRQPLPTRVWWPGMLADVAVFGGPLLLLLCVPRMTRGWVRRRRGACLGCGYDVRGMSGVCPECGAAVGALGKAR